jgi:hypothetical protein
VHLCHKLRLVTSDILDERNYPSYFCPPFCFVVEESAFFLRIEESVFEFVTTNGYIYMGHFTPVNHVNIFSEKSLLRSNHDEFLTRQRETKNLWISW